MEKIRIGNNISVIWAVKRNGLDVDLTGKTVKLYMTHPKGREEYKDKVNINGNVLYFVFDGLKQKVLGRYTLTIDVRNEDGTRLMIQDKCGAFTLVGRSCEERQDEESYVINL